MAPISTIVIYCVLIAAVSLGGGYVPLAVRLSHVKLQAYLSLSAGAMLGAAFFHMMPEAAHMAPEQFSTWMAVGVIGLYMMERFVSPHSHDIAKDNHHHTAGQEREHLDHQPAAVGLAFEMPGHEHRPAAPQVAGWSAVCGLFIHTLLGGAALGSAVLGPGSPAELGFAVFLATALHKPADSFTISVLLLKTGVAKRKALAVQIVFALMIPLGVLLLAFGESALRGEVLEGSLTGRVLAFSAGTFVCIALSDLLPEVQFHSHDRIKLFAAVLAGAAIMWATSLLEQGHAH